MKQIAVLTALFLLLLLLLLPAGAQADEPAPGCFLPTGDVVITCPRGEIQAVYQGLLPDPYSVQRTISCTGSIYAQPWIAGSYMITHTIVTTQTLMVSAGNVYQVQLP